MTKERYVKKYIELYAKLCKNPDDYADKSKIRKNNKAARALYVLDSELRKDIVLMEKVYSDLLENEDKCIRQSTASGCLAANLHIKRSVEILEHIARSNDRWEAMPAERTLKIWRGEIDPNDPG